MRSLGVSEDDVPATDLTQNDRPADALVEQARFVAAVERGLADAGAGRVTSHEEVVRRMAERYAA